MEKKRLNWADSLKGWLITLVVLGHAIQNTLGAACDSSHIWNLIYSFHMPAFMAVSGYLAFRNNTLYRDISFCRSLIHRRFFQLLLPFLIWTALLMLLKGNISWNTIKMYIFYPDKGLWFLWVLFFINLIFIIGNWFAEHLKVKQAVVLLLLCLLLVGVMVVFEFRLFGFQFVAYYFLFYTLGYYIHKYEDLIISNNLVVIASITLCWFVLAWFWKMHELPSWLESIPLPKTLMQYTYRFFTAALAIYVLLTVSPQLLNSDKWYSKPFVNLGIVSLGIYTTHFVLIGRIVQLFLYTRWSEIITIIASFVVALLVSWLIVWVLSKWRLTERYMLGKV